MSKLFTILLSISLSLVIFSPFTNVMAEETGIDSETSTEVSSEKSQSDEESDSESQIEEVIETGDAEASETEIVEEPSEEENNKASRELEDDSDTESTIEKTENSRREDEKTGEDQNTEAVSQDADEDSETAEPVVEIPTAKTWRLYNPNNGEHFYTNSEKERDYLYSVGWNIEGFGWVAPQTSSSPVYRLYNKNVGDHHYTKSEKERDFLVSKGWKYEGISFYSCEQGDNTVPVYREYNPNTKTGAHNFTTSINEHNKLIAAGWKDEGIAFYESNKCGAEGRKIHPVQYSPTFYTQGDGRWSWCTYNGYTMAGTGCSPTSIAMAIDGILHNGVNPKNVADYLFNNTNYFNKMAVGSYGICIRLGAEHWGLKTYGIDSYEKLVYALSNGYIVVFAVGPGTFVNRGYTHAITLFSYSGGNTQVYDPNAGRGNGWYSVASIWNQRSQDPADYNEGYWGYGIYK